MNLKDIFWNSAENRIRAGWRIGLTYALIMIVFLPIQYILRKVLPSDWSRDIKIDMLLACFAIVATFMIIVSRKFIDKKKVSSLGLKFDNRSLLDFAVGLAISFILVAVIVGVEIGFGWLTYKAEQPDWLLVLQKSVYLFLFSGLFVGWWENLFFVSYLFQNVRDGLGFTYSLIINLILFSLIHMLNPNASPMAFVGIVLIHSYEIFGYLRTGNLWLILGIHAGWNFSQGLAGFTISGRPGMEVLQFINTAPAWFGGDLFGPESGAIIVITTAIAYTLILYYSRLTRTSFNRVS